MAKLTGPLLSLEARGSFGPRLTFSARHSNNLVRFQRAQTDFESTKRAPQREAFRLGMELWSYLPEPEREYWVQVERKGYAIV